VFKLTVQRLLKIKTLEKLSSSLTVRGQPQYHAHTKNTKNSCNFDLWV